MAQKYLDYDGLLYFWQKLKNYFVTDVTYASSSRKIQKTKAGTTSDVVTLATVATSGSYNDLSNKPTIPAGVEPSTTTPKMDGTATVGTETKFARGDHIHPTDTSRVPTSRQVNGKSLSGNIILTGDDIPTEMTFSSTVLSQYGDGTPLDDVLGAIDGWLNTAEEKLDGIQAGAEVNQNAFSNVKVGSTTISADTKTDTLELVAGSNVTLTPDATNDKVTINASHPTYTSFTGKPTSNQTPGFGSTFTISQISQSTTGQVSGTDRTVKIPDTVASSSANGLMSSTDKDKLDGISGQTLDLVAGNNITITPNTTSGTLTITATDTTYPSGTSTELSNGSVTATRVWTPKILHDYVAGEIQTAITGAVAYQGVAPTNFAPTNYQAGWYWIVGTAGTYCGQVCEAGDMIFCKTAGTAYSASNFDVVQTNLDITAITNAEIDTIMAS